MQQLHSIRVLRGFAVSIVFAHHFMSPFYNFKPTNWLGDIFSNYGAFGVDIFFVISGFIMAYILYGKKYSSQKFILNRIIRIVPAYWFWTMFLLFITLGVGVDTLFVEDTNYQSILMSLFFISHEHPSTLLGGYPVLTVGWTLNIEMFFYLTIALFLLSKRSVDILLIMLIILFIFFPVIWYIFEYDFYKIVLGNLRLFEFSTGMSLSFMWHHYQKVLNKKIFIYFIGLLFIGLYYLPFYLIIKWIIAASLLVYLALILEEQLSKDILFLKILSFLGKISFSLYLIHGIIIRTLYYIFGSIESPLECTMLFLLAMIVSIILSTLSFDILEVKTSVFLKKKMKRI